MGNNSSADEEEYEVLKILPDSLEGIRRTIKEDNLENFQLILQSTKTVDTNAYLEFTDALVAEKDGKIYTLKGLFKTKCGRDPLEQLLESGYVISMLEYAQRKKSRNISSWLSEQIDTVKLEDDLSANPLPDLIAMTKDWDGIPEGLYIEECNSSDLLRVEGITEILLQGGIPFWYTSEGGSKLSSRTKAIVRSVVNLTDFDDEVAENGVPHIDIDNATDAKQYSFVVGKNLKLAPVDDIDLISLDLLCSHEYQSTVQSQVNANARFLKAGEDGWNPKNNRTIRSVTKIVGALSITLQIQISEYSEEEVKALNANPHISGGVEWDRGIISERTKQNINNKDSTAKMKVLTMLKQLDGGVLMSVISVTANTLAPSWMISLGKKKAMDTAAKAARGSRLYFRTRFSGHRCKGRTDV